MIYLDSSVALARLLSESRHMPDVMWNDTLVSSRLLEYEVWNRIHARRLGRQLGETVQTFIDHIGLFELTPTVLARAVEPLPMPVRTLDALHLATIEYLKELGAPVRLASFDNKMVAAARALRTEIYDLG